MRLYSGKPAVFPDLPVQFAKECPAIRIPHQNIACPLHSSDEIRIQIFLRPEEGTMVFCPGIGDHPAGIPIRHHHQGIDTAHEGTKIPLAASAADGVSDTFMRFSEFNSGGMAQKDRFSGKEKHTVILAALAALGTAKFSAVGGNGRPLSDGSICPKQCISCHRLVYSLIKASY